MGEKTDCRTCKRTDCLKEGFLVFRNVPQSSGLYGKVKHVTRRKVWRYLDAIRIAADMPLINKLKTFLGICPNAIIGDGVFDIINRWAYCKANPAVPAFAGDYDSQPPEWVWAVNIIEDELSKIREHGRKD